MKKIFTYSFLVISILAGCQVKELEAEISTEQEVLPARDSKPFVAIIEEDSVGNETKTTLDNSGNVLWKQGDQVSVFAGSTVNEHYQVSDSSDGKTHATLYKIPDDGFVAGTDIDNNVAFYPFASTASVAKSGDGYVISDIKLLATQNYAAGSFGNGAFPMAAITSSIEDMNLQFKNVLGGLKLQLKGTATITSITVTGNNNEILCGDAAVTTTYGGVPSIALSDASAKTVTLDCGAGVPLDSETATPFIIALPPMTMTGGFTVVVTDSESKQMEMKTTKPQTISRSNLLKMPAVNYVGAAKPFTITSTGTTSVAINKSNTPNDIVLDYKKGDGDWTSYTIGNSIDLTDGQTLQFRAGVGGNATFSGYTGYYKVAVSGTGTVEVSGNIMTLLDRDGLSNTLSGFDFMGLFENCTKLVDAGDLLLPATILANCCYDGMFNGCSSLTATPALPATTLAQGCYHSMFRDCHSLTTAPALPATTLAQGCYYRMFENCTSLTTAPELPATTLAEDCYYGMFSHCTSLTTAPALPATTLAQGCYYRMFENCTSLTTAPVLPATTLVNLCYSGMFDGCSKLNYIKMLATNIAALNCLSDWVKDVAATGTFVKNGTASWNVTGASGVPAGWTVLTAITTPEVVDLGLSVKWATFDLGAEYEGDFGYAYSWGELEPWTDRTTWQYYSHDKSPDVLPLSDDVANVKLGGNWRMPTEEEIKELVANCTVTYETVNSVSCLKLTSKKNGQSIYLPRYRFYNDRVLPEQGDVSYFWTSSIYASDTDYAVFYCYDSNHTSFPIDRSNRYCGLAIRPVWSDNNSGTQLVSNEPVDLGLSVKWASCNLGANSPEEYGDYYAWGETEPKEDYSWSTYKWCNGSSTTLTKYNTNSSYGTVDNKTVLELEDDVAHVKLGGKWRMPTDEEWTELRTKCTWTWVTNYKGSGISGRLVEATNWNRIFLPAAGYRYGTYLYNADSNGYYWSSSLETALPYYARHVNFPSDYVYRNSNYRYFGLFVRPVSE